MNRLDAIDLARAHALGHGQTGGHAYLPTTDAEAAEWLPHAWVVDAIVSAAEERERATDAVPAPTLQMRGLVALENFTEYFVRNYPGPNTIIHDPRWHAPKLFKAALAAIHHSGAATPEAVSMRSAAAPLTVAQLNDIASKAQITFCLGKQESFDVAFARGIERAHGIDA